MARSRIKPATPLAKAIAAFDADCRKQHPKFDQDVLRFGRDAAVFNAGFLKSDSLHKRKARKRAKR